MPSGTVISALVLSETGPLALMLPFQPGRAWADATLFSVTRFPLSSLLLFVGHFPYLFSLCFVMPGVWLANLRSCALPILASSSAPILQTVLTEPGPSYNTGTLPL